MARKNASRVAATRSRSRNRPGLMVAPERDTPGIRATHCTKPMITASFRLTEGLRAIPLADPLGDPHHRTPAHERHHHHPQVAQRARDQAWARKPTIPIGIEPTMTYQANR